MVVVGEEDAERQKRVEDASGVCRSAFDALRDASTRRVHAHASVDLLPPSTLFFGPSESRITCCYTHLTLNYSSAGAAVSGMYRTQ